MKTQVNFDALGGGGDLTFTNGGITSPFTVDANHKYAYIDLYRINATPVVTLNGTTLTADYIIANSGYYFYTYIIPNVKTGDTITMTLGMGRIMYID